MRKRMFVWLTAVFMILASTPNNVINAFAQDKTKESGIEETILSAADDYNWIAFVGKMTTADTVAAGNNVTFTVSVTNTTDTPSNLNVYSWYYRERYNSETYPGEGFGKIAGAEFTQGEDDSTGSLNLQANGSSTLTITGVMPSTWNEKSCISVVFSDSPNKRMGQVEYPEETFPESPQTEAPQTETPAPAASSPAPAVVQEPITVPKKPASAKAKVKGNKVTISWKKIKKNKKGKALLKQIKSIQIQYSTDPSFQANVATKSVGKNKTKITLKLQKKTVYYIRMRYVGSNGVSAWTGVKRVKTK